MKLRLDPTDEYLHPLEEASNFNESMYFNVVDPTVGVGGFFRLGNRPNEGRAEMTTCLYLPDGRVAFMFDRPAISGNEAFDAGGMRFAVVEPFRELSVSYDGRVVLLDDPLAMADPRTAFKENPWTECHADLTFRGISPMYGGEPVNDDGTPIPESGEGFARGHYEQHTAGTGTISVGDQSWTIDGLGLRDHSWGPRFWQSPWWYRWLTANLGPDFGFVVSIVAGKDGQRRIGGMVLRDGAYEHITDATVATTWTGDDLYHQEIRATATTAQGASEIGGTVRTLVPWRNRRTGPDGEELLTRISEGLTEWRCQGRTGHGLSEYLDQIVDGRPVGYDG